MDCVNCGASLTTKSNVCKHCGTLNDVDLRAIGRSSVRGPATDRVCPRCEQPLLPVELHVDGELFIERCDRCLGIFFDPGELETLLDASVSNIAGVDLDRMSVLIDERGDDDAPEVSYVKCPICGELMNRENFGRGARSGVIVDICRKDGVWLDGGELSKLLNWTKAGGMLLADDKREQRAKKRERKQAAQRRDLERRPVQVGSDDVPFNAGLRAVVRFILHLLR